MTAMFCRKRPVPAAHLSFIRKLTTFPSRSKAMTLLSCPPMSRIVRTPPGSPSRKSRPAPTAWQEISVTRPSASTAFRP